MDLAVVVDGHHADHGSGLGVPCQQHRAGVDAIGGCGVAESRPAEAVVVLCVQIGYEIEIVHGSPAFRSGLMIRVEPIEVLAVHERLNSLVEAWEHDGEVPRACVRWGRAGSLQRVASGPGGVWSVSNRTSGTS